MRASCARRAASFAAFAARAAAVRACACPRAPSLCCAPMPMLARLRRAPCVGQSGIIYCATKKQCDEKNNELLETEFEASAETSKMIHFLRKENKKLREKNRKIFESNYGLRVNNGRLEDANNQTDTSFGTLNSHAKEINETNAKLNEVVPKYEGGIEKMKEAVEVRQQYCVSEHKIRLLYTKCIGQIVMMAEKKCKDENLVDEIVEYAMEREDQEHDETLPPALDENLANSSDKENEKKYESDAEDCEDGTANNGS